MTIQKKKLVFGAFGALLTIWFLVRITTAVTERQHAAKGSVATVSVLAQAVTRRNLAQYVELTGTVRPQNEAEIFSKLPGRVDSLSAKVGDVVRKGSILATVEHREIELQLLQANAQVKATQAAVEQSHTQFANVEVEHKRYKTLHDSKAVSDSDFEKMEAAYLSARSAIQVAEAQNDLARAARELAKEMINNSRITSPIDGVVTKKNVNIGTQLAPGFPAFQVQDYRALKLESSVDVDQFHKLEIGQKVFVKADSNTELTAEGKISSLTHSLDPQTRRAAVEVVIDNRSGQLLTNQLVKAVVKVAERSNVLTIPGRAILNLPKGNVVYALHAQKPVLKMPRLGIGDSENVEVIDGLVEGEQIIVSGQADITEDTPIEVVQNPAAERR